MIKIYIYSFLLLLISACGREIDDWQENFILETIFENNDSRLLTYNVICEDDKQIVWREEFDNNDSKWPVDTSKYRIISKDQIFYTIFPTKELFKTIQMNAGFLKIYSTNSNIEYIDIPFLIDENENFEIEMRTFITDNIIGRSQPRIINILSAENNSKYNLFLYKWNDYIDIVLEKEEREKHIQFFDWDSEDYININNFNITTIRKIGGKYAFFLNHKLLYILNDNKFSCNKFSIVLKSGVEYMFDYVRISYLK